MPFCLKPMPAATRGASGAAVLLQVWSRGWAAAVWRRPAAWCELALVRARGEVPVRGVAQPRRGASPRHGCEPSAWRPPFRVIGHE
jgi:hypothetical protein